MTHAVFLSEMDAVLELPAGTLTGAEKLEDLERWDSTAMLGFIALADTHNGASLSPRHIVNCATVADLLRLAQVDGETS
jgi:acyl carrier protein